ncbi:MAG: M4 family metallopeptidase [Lentisphaerae bacterium]|nr:M4 family metallopeptidase [Lentisphaerota bacterium]
MSDRQMWKVWAVSVVLFPALAFQGLSFRADDLRPSQAGPAAIQAATPVKQPVAAQVRAAASLPDVTVVWDKVTGAPGSVRGDNLTARNLGGKGLQLRGNLAQDAIAVMDGLTDLFLIRDAENELAHVRTDADELGFHHVRLQQKAGGLTVVGAELIVHFNKDGRAYQVNGRFIPHIDVATTPGIDGETAVQSAQADLAAQGITAPSTLSQAPELVIYARQAAPVLAWQLTLTCKDPEKGPGCWRYWIHAATGAVINRYNDIQKQTLDLPRTSATITGVLLGGEGGSTVGLSGDLTGGLYYLFNTTWGIFNLATTGYADNNAWAWRSTAAWGTSDAKEFSAAYNLSGTLATYLNRFSRNSYDNSGTRARCNVHTPGNDAYNNAYWDPSVQQMFFGSVDGTSMADLEVTDVLAHEFTHAVTEKTADLVYQNESGALNESFSDIFGAIVEFATQPDGRSSYPNKVAGAADWLLAEDATIGSSVCMRDMRNPGSAATSSSADGYPQPSRYRGSNWYSGSGDNGGVHINSGVQNLFFYLLCEGGSGNNDGTTYSVTGLGITNAGLVAYRALTTYCSANTDYSGARAAWISAAQDLNSAWVSSVQAAWAAVGVSSNATPTPTSGSAVNDFDGNGASDFVLYDWQYYGAWYATSLYTDGWLFYGYPWGANGFLPVYGDFNGGGQADLMVYSPAAGLWYLLLLENGGSGAFSFGGPTMWPVAGDFDGDGASDLAAYDVYSGLWYIYSFYNGWVVYGGSWGAYGYLPVSGDFNGGGRTDLAVYSQTYGYWYIFMMETGEQITMSGFGSPGLRPVSGDYDADGTTDLALYDYTTGLWYIYSLTQGWVTYAFQWGGSGYMPVGGDFDGLGYSDMAVYNQGNGSWYVYYPDDKTYSAFTLGGPGLIPSVDWLLY